MLIPKLLVSAIVGAGGVLVAQAVPGGTPALPDVTEKLVTWILLALVALVGWFVRATLADIKGAIGDVERQMELVSVKLEASLARFGALDLTIAHLESRISAIELRCNEKCRAVALRP